MSLFRTLFVVESMECMVHQCNSCPGIQNVVNYVTAKLLQNERQFEEDEKIDEDKTIEYKQWSTANRGELLSCSSTVGEFIESLCEKLDTITSHSYIAKAKGKYLNKLKSFIPPKLIYCFG